MSGSIALRVVEDFKRPLKLEIEEEERKTAEALRERATGFRCVEFGWAEVALAEGEKIRI